MKDIVSILTRKNKITGDDIGRLLLADMAHEFSTFLETGKVKTLFTQAEFNAVLDRLKEAYHIKRYNNYISLHNTIRSYYMLTEGLKTSAELKLSNFKTLLWGLQSLIEKRIEEKRHPKIMTQKEFEEKYSQAQKEVFSWTYPYIELFNTALWYFCQREEQEADEKLTSIKKTYSEQPIKSKKLQECLNETYSAKDNAKGYYKFKNNSLIVSGTLGSFLTDLKARNICFYKPERFKAQDLKKDLTNAMIEELLTEEQIKEHLEFEEYAPKPDKLTKMHLLKDFDFIECADIFSNEKNDQKETITIFKEFKKEVPELVEYLTEKILSYDTLKRFKGITDEYICKEQITFEELYTNKVLSYDDENINNYFNENYLDRYEGVAILNNNISSFLFNNDIDEKGYYKPNKVIIAQQTYWNEQLLEACKIVKEETKDIYKPFYNYVLRVNAHNAFIDIVAKTTGIDGLKVFTYPLNKIKEEVDNFNHTLSTLLNYQLSLYALHYNYEEAQEIKEMLLKCLPYIDLSNADIPQERLDEAREYISELDNFQSFSISSKPLYILCGEEDEE